METKELKEITERRSRRGFSAEAVARDVVERIVDAGRRAPSCANKQPVRFLVLTEPASLEKGHKALSRGNYWAEHGTFLVYILTNRSLSCNLPDGRNYAWFDAGLAVENMLLQAVHEGLIGHPMAGFTPQVVHDEFDIPDEYEVVTAIAFGYPGNGEYLNEHHAAGEISEQVRKPREETVFENSWN